MFADARLVLALAVVAASVAPVHTTSTGACAVPHVGAALQAAVEARLGRRVEVTLESFTCALTTDTPPALAATPDPLARTGRPVRFALVTTTPGSRGRVVRLGQATAIVHVAAEHVRLRKMMPAGSTLTAEDLEIATGPIEDMALRRVPTLSELVGARLTRGLAGGAPVPADAVVAAPAVKFGEQVQMTLRQGGVEVTMLGVAEQNAAIGQVIRVINASSRRPLRARVIAPGEVEVVHER